MDYELVIGLEVHVKLKSINKLFCECPNSQEFDDQTPNLLICPVCTAQPGALPTLQKDAIKKAMFLGKALKCEFSKTLSFDRKSYFYPDLPSGYQITQIKNPISFNGRVDFYIKNFEQKTSIKIKQAHIENDTGKTNSDGEKSFIDFNRSGTPLVEIVTEPDFRTDEEVIEFLKEIQRLVRRNHIASADLEKGQMRCDVNISVRKKGTSDYGTRVELKNINSFGAIKRAIANEYQRQVDLIESGGLVEQETRRRNDMGSKSYVMRSKADALDYRYFPEPDLPERLVPKDLLDLVAQKKITTGFDVITEFKEKYNFSKEYINGLLNDETGLNRFLTLAGEGFEPKTVAKWIVGPINSFCNERNRTVDILPIMVEDLREFLSFVVEKKLQDHHSKMIMHRMLYFSEKMPDIRATFKVDSFDESELVEFAKEVISEHQNVVTDYKGGKVNAMGFLIGQFMKKSVGRSNPADAKRIFEDLLQSP